MKRFVIFFLLAVAVSLRAEELLKNSNFKVMESSDYQKSVLEKKNITLSGNKLPSYWNFNSTWKGGAITPDKNYGLRLNSPAAELILAARNYRIKRNALGKGKLCMSIAFHGTGLVRFVFYCYDKRGKYLTTLRLGKVEVKDFSGVKSVVIDTEKISPKCASIVPFFRFKGSFNITGVSLLPGGVSQLKYIPVKPPKTSLPENFKSASIKDKIDIIENSKDYGIPLAALSIDTPEDKERMVRYRACYKLGTFGEGALGAASKLAEQLNSRIEAVRVHAAVALTKLGPGAYPAIKKLLLSQNRGIRLCMANSVRGMPNGVPAELASEVAWASPPAVMAGSTLHPDSSFEGASPKKLSGWKVDFVDGAEGSWEVVNNVARTGVQSLKITKTNGKGYILISSSYPIVVPANVKKPRIFRFYYKCSNAGYNTLLMPRFITDTGTFKWHDTRYFGGAGWQSQSLLRNTPKHSWERRLIMVGSRSKPQALKPAVVLYGNPVTVYLDDLQFPAPAWQGIDSGRTYSQPRYSLSEANKIIEKRSPVTAEVYQEKNGKCVILLNGKKVAPVFSLTFNGFTADHGIFNEKCGIHMPVTMVSLNGSFRYPPFTQAWNGTGKPDFSPMFKTIEQSIRKAPNSNFILGLSIVWPRNYVDQHPEEEWINAKGQRAYGTIGHMMGFTKKLSNNKTFWWPSQYSKLAWDAAGKVISDFLIELKKKPYSKIIAGVFVTGGHDGQFHIHHRDYGKRALEAWRAFLKERYNNNPKALAEAWKIPGMTFEKASIPVEKPADIGNSRFYCPEKNRMQADFKELEERQVWKNSEYFIKIFKKIFGQKKLGLTWCLGGGWRKDFSYVYKSKYFDGFAGQPMYHYRLPGYSGGFNMVEESCLAHKTIAISELDTRSWIRGVYPELYRMRISVPLSANQFKATVLKEAGRMIAAYQGFWFYDMGDGTFRHPASLEIIRKVRAASDFVFKNAYKDNFKPDSVFVFSQKSIYWDIPLGYGQRGNLPSILVDEQLWALRASGVPSTSSFLSDLMKNENYKKYKVFVFMNAYYLSPAEREFINSKLKRNGNTLIWIYASGFIDDKSMTAENIYKLTNIKVEYQPEPGDMTVIKTNVKSDLMTNVTSNLGVADAYRRRFELGNKNAWKQFMPRFKVIDDKAQILGKYLDGAKALAVKEMKDWTSVYCAAPGGLDVNLYHNIAENAGVFVASQPGVVLAMNGSFVSLHALKGGKYHIKLPRKAAKIIDAMTGKTLAVKQDYIDLKLTAQQSLWLLLK